METRDDVLISVKDLKKYYNKGAIKALDGVTVDINKGDVMVVIGPSGSGKSTFLRSLNLMEHPTGGTIMFDGVDITSKKIKNAEGQWVKLDIDEHRQKMGMVFQHFNLFPHMTIMDNITLAPMKVKGVSKEDAEKKAIELLNRVGLADRANAYPIQLSGGQKQRVAIARVLASDPQILLSDEATSALDPETTRSILALLREINEKTGITIVLITHEMAVVQEICRNVIVMENGRIAEEGKVEEIFRNPKTEAARRLLVNAGSPIQIMQGGRFIRLSFREFSAFEPVIGNAILKFRTPINILYADTHRLYGKVNGQMIVELPPDQKTAEEMIAYFEEKDLGVEEWTDAER